MEDKIKNILNLSKISVKENQSQLKIINWKTKTIDKGSLLLWAYILLFFGITYVSMKLIEGAKSIGKPELFINGCFLFLEVIIIIKTILLSSNIFFFSRDIENILYLPFKPTDILISKYLSILILNYEIIALFGVIPIFLYGHLTNLGLIYVIKIIPVLILFPILWTSIISIIMMFLIKRVKIFKNKDTLQLVISIILIILIFILLSIAFSNVFSNIDNDQTENLNEINNKIVAVNRYFININPSINILQKGNNIINFLVLILSSIIALTVFVFLGKKLYLKQILKANFYYKNTKVKKVRKIKQKGQTISYIKKEFKTIIKNPMFLMQTLYPVIMMTITICVLIITVTPRVTELLNSEEYRDKLQYLTFNIEICCIILGILQFIGLSNYSSVTAFSRDGKDAYIAKYLPISLYKQFIYKNIPQILINTICNIVVLITFKLQIPAIESKYIIILFAISFLLTMINSYILSIIDLLMPKLKWNAEYELFKNNKNKLLQYVLLILNIFLLIFINKMFRDHNLEKSLYTIIATFLVIFVAINYIIYKKKEKMYKKIQ